MSFNDLIRNLDYEAIGDNVFPIASGRAYSGLNGLYADKIHTFPIDEDYNNIVNNMRPTGGLYFGTGGLLNLKYLSQSQASHGVLFDINPFQTIFWNVVFGSMRKNKNFDDFKQSLNYSEVFTRRIIQRKLRSDTFSSAGSYTEKFDCNLNSSLLRRGFSNNSFCISSCLKTIGFSDTDYDHVRQMACSKNLSTLTLDVFDKNSWTSLAAALREYGNEDKTVPSTPSYIYVSSLFNFIDSQKDWTGKYREDFSMPAFMQNGDVVIIDNKRLYSSQEFSDHICKVGEKCQKLQQNPQASVPVHGRGRLGLAFD